MGSSTSVYIYANYLGNLRPTLPLRLSGSDRKRELAGIPPGSARFDPSETFLEISDLTGKRESLSRGEQMAVALFRQSIRSTFGNGPIREGTV